MGINQHNDNDYFDRQDQNQDQDEDQNYVHLNVDDLPTHVTQRRGNQEIQYEVNDFVDSLMINDILGFAQRWMPLVDAREDVGELAVAIFDRFCALADDHYSDIGMRETQMLFAYTYGFDDEDNIEDGTVVIDGKMVGCDMHKMTEEFLQMCHQRLRAPPLPDNVQLHVDIGIY